MTKSIGWGALTALIVFIVSILIGLAPIAYAYSMSGAPCSTGLGLEEMKPICDSSSFISQVTTASLYVFWLGAPVTSLAAGIIVAVRKEKKRRRTTANIATS